jgi:hypothetical protein
MKLRKIYLLTLAVLILLQLNKPTPIIQIAIGSPADVYGNDIDFIEIWQYNGTDYILKANLTSDGGTVRVEDNKPIKFVIGIQFNNSLAINSQEAIDYTKVLMNITYNSNFIWQNVELNNTACITGTEFYFLFEEGVWNQTSYPKAGETYECSVLYQAYY